MEFFNNIVLWLVNNSDEIVLTITSANFITFITSIVLLIKTLKSTKDNTKSSNNLNLSLNENNKLLSTINEINEKITLVLNNDDEFKKYQTECIEILNLLLSKLNLMIEAQSQVWSTIKDDTIRNNVNTILTSAKYKDTSTIIDLKNQLEDLKNKMVQKTEELSTYIKNEELDKPAEELVKEVKEIKNKVTRI